MIIPVLTYCSVLSIFANKSRAEHLKSIDVRATRIVNRHAHQAHAVTLPSIALIKKKHYMLVCKCIDGKLCENFAKYLSLLSHEKRTRNNPVSLNLPSVKTEFLKRSVFLSVAKLYNELPAQFRQLKNS